MIRINLIIADGPSGRQLFIGPADKLHFSLGGVMEQRFEGTPQATIRLEGRRLIRSEVTNDWGLRLQWEIKRNGQIVAVVNARTDLAYEHVDTARGEYSVVLQMWRYVNYAKNPQGEFTQSRFIDISNRVTYTI